MQQLMKQMGIQQQEIDSSKVIIEKNDGKKIILEHPSVLRINMQGQRTYQISGEEKEVSLEDSEAIKEEDIKLIVKKTNCSEKQALDTLKKTKGDLAEAISLLIEKE